MSYRSNRTEDREDEENEKDNGSESSESGSDKEQEDEDKDSGGKRRVFLFGRLENEVALPVIKRLLRLNDKDPKTPIDLIINSAGGNGYNADAIIATIHSLSAPVNTICFGHALSGACEILASGTGMRKAYEFATLMFHQTLWEADGDITNLEIQAKQGLKFRDAQIDLLARCSGQDKKIIRQDIERDHYMTSKEALAYGLIDEIVHHRHVRMPERRRAAAASAAAAAAEQAAQAAQAAPAKVRAAARAVKKTTASRTKSQSRRGKRGTKAG
ncbi:MAG: ATP-dependent Clp protease proteolytic subunit [Candidatus Obscuribacterales bacterium]|jgi:ATP-dependent Clp protease protease subunit